jgi:hypothetical protein
MKKWLTIIGVIAVILGVAAFNSKFYYPSLPIKSVSKKEVLQSINNSSESIVKIADENGYEWFITRMEQGQGRENFKQMMSENGWEFNTQEGSGYFFEKGERTLIATTQMWTGKYVIVQIPEGWR